MNKRIRKKITKRKSYEIHRRFAEAATEAVASALSIDNPIGCLHIPIPNEQPTISIEDFRKEALDTIVNFMNESFDGAYKFRGRIVNGNVEIFPIKTKH